MVQYSEKRARHGVYILIPGGSNIFFHKKGVIYE